jgi:regulatory protein
VEITRIQRHRGRRARYAIFVDGIRALDVHESIVLDQRLCSGDDIDPPTIQRLESLDAELTARETAINYLSYRPRSVREVLDHLQRKKIPRPIAEQVAQRLEQLRLLNDLEFARMFVRDRMRQKRYGQTLIRKKLNRSVWSLRKSVWNGRPRVLTSLKCRSAGSA